MGTWQGVRTADGSWTLLHPVHGQSCHSLAGAWQEARERYALACRLRERARPGGELRLLDIGTGLGLNLAAALEALDGTGARLVAHTLELDASVFAALDLLPNGSDEQKRWHAPVRRALVAAGQSAQRGELQLELEGLPASSAGVELRLTLGDARATLARESAETGYDAVFLDAFSPRVEGDLWSPAFLADVARAMADDGVLSTYSVSLPVRRALVAAGLAVGCGPAVGTKSAGTLASRRAWLPPLDPRTARRLARRPAPLG